jgi:small-conductance mechanosensitive channel
LFAVNPESIFSFQLFNDPVLSWLKALAIVLAMIIFGKFVHQFLREWALIGVFAASRYLHLSETADLWMLWLFSAVMLNRIIRIVSSFMDHVTDKVYLEREGVDSGSRAAIRHILLILKIAVAGILIVIALDNLGFNISAMIAGLGVTGIVIGLAVQNIVGDLFSSFCIIFDKPFEVGDFIIVGDFMGVVDNVGIKTTRLTSLGGEQLVFSNSDLTGSRIRNYKRMAKRRVVFSLSVEYGTEEEKLKTIPSTVKTIISAIDDTAFDRAHLQRFGDSSLLFEVVYYVLSSDYNKYMDIQQEINLRILSGFKRESINFAFPTQTLHLREEKATWFKEASALS